MPAGIALETKPTGTGKADPQGVGVYTRRHLSHCDVSPATRKVVMPARADLGNSTDGHRKTRPLIETSGLH